MSMMMTEELQLEITLARGLTPANRCNTVAMVEDAEGAAVPVACGFRAGHQGVHAWSGMSEAGSKPPGPRGSDRTRAAYAARRARTNDWRSG